ncbi:MAG: hypothetical protein A2Z18_04730 [Armatimonadetes bacterium RBG_16_58_9]|nr:MAG: hypothetical protein A2Z18_04730 [Armatimonadetes bacterium RBG_16_58_9]
MEKKGLGKGLGALIPGAEREVRAAGTEIEISHVSFNPYQPRASVADEKLQELVDSIRVHGVLQPIVVRSKGNGEYELVAGERRLRAASAAGLTRIPAVVREMSNEQSLEAALVENLQREDINPVDAALAYKRLVEEFGLTQEELAFQVGKSRSAVANLMRLLNLPEQVVNFLRNGAISEGHARAIASVEGESWQTELCRRVVTASLTVRETERLARDWVKSGGDALRRENVSRETMMERQDPNILDLEAQLRDILGTKVRITRGKDRGRIEIEFYSDDDLHRILTLLAGG